MTVQQRTEEPRLLPSSVDPLVRSLAPAWRADGPAAPTGGTGRRLLRPLMWALATAVAGQSVLHVLDVALFDLSIDRFNADKDGSLAGWLGTVTTWSVAGAAAVLALLVRDLRRPLLLVAGICTFLSVDDMLSLHEIVARLALGIEAFPHAEYVLWPLVYLPLMSLLGWLLLRTARSVDVGNGRLLVAGLICLAVAVGLEATAPVLYALGSDQGQPLYEAEVTVEEALETTGWGLIAIGLLSTVVDALLDRAWDLSPQRDLSLVAGPHGASRPARERRGTADRRSGDRRAGGVGAPGPAEGAQP